MSTNNEEKINKLLDFPYDAFLMVRLEYVQILGDELEAKLLRIIEKYVDIERKRIYREMINAAPANNGQVVEVSKDIWVPISYRLFMNDLFGTVTSENTVKKALKDMTKKKIIFQRFQPKKKYDAPEYKIHVNPLQTLLSMLPNPGYQKLIPSYIDTLKDLPPQELTPSECQKLIPLAALRVSKIDTNITEVTDNNREVITEERESTPNTLDTTAVVSSDTAHAEYPLITFAHCLTYLQEQGVAPRGEDAVQVMVQARTLYAHKHPLQDEKMFTDEKPQGDTHAAATSGHPHRVGEPAAPGGDSDHGSVDDGHVAAPEARPVLEARQEIDKGDTHATRIPTVPAANHPASSERAVSRSGSDHSHSPSVSADGLPAVCVVGSGTSGQEAGRDTRDAGRDATQTLAQTPPTSTPAQSLPLPQDAQAASGTRGKGKKPAQPKVETRSNPPVEPPADMAWGTRKCLLWFDFWRGGILIGKWKLMQASTCAKGLAEQFDEQTVIQVRTDMEADPYYAAKGGCDVCDVANNIHKYLKRRHNKQKPQSPNVDSATNEPLLSVEEEFGRYWGINEKRVNEKRGVSYATA